MYFLKYIFNSFFGLTQYAVFQQFVVILVFRVFLISQLFEYEVLGISKHFRIKLLFILLKRTHVQILHCLPNDVY